MIFSYSSLYIFIVPVLITGVTSLSLQRTTNKLLTMVAFLSSSNSIIFSLIRDFFGKFRSIKTKKMIKNFIFSILGSKPIPAIIFAPTWYTDNQKLSDETF